MSWLSDVFQKGGPFFIVNTFFLAIVIGLIVERAIYFLGRGHLNAKAFLEQLRKLLSANNVDRAKKLCDATTAPVARVAKAGLNRLHRGEAAVAQAMEETMTDTLPEVKTRIGALWSLANICTLVGLLGTITGLIRTFAGIGDANPADRQKKLSDGISEAMYNTAFGLSIALICMIGHLLLSAAMKKVVSDLEAFSLRFENLLSEGAAAPAAARAPAAPTDDVSESAEALMEYSAQRVRGKTRAAVKRREETIEQEEMESGELNLIPYLDMVTNLMLFLLASVSAGLILVQIDTTLPDKKPPSPTQVTQPSTNPDDQPLKLFVSIKRDEMILWSASGLEGTLAAPKATFKRTGKDGEPCDGPYMCESNACDGAKQRCVPSKDEPAPVFDYRLLNKTLIEIATRRYAGKQRKADTYQIILQADGAVPYSTVVSAMSAMRCVLPEFGKEPMACALPTEDENLKKAKEPISPDGKLYDTTRASYDPKKMALFPEIQFSSGFE